MTERDDVLGMLDQWGALRAFCWAYGSAAARVLEDYSEDAGHDVAWFGYTRHKLFCDRLDRVYSCGRYAVPDDADGRSSLDVVRAELTQHDIDTMPMIPPRTVVRSKLNQSPGWTVGDTRLLLQSIPPGKGSESITWVSTRPTKRLVASQPSSDSTMPSLFDTLEPHEQIDLSALFPQPAPLDVRTLVVAHALNPLTGARELVLGRPRLNDGGGRPWHWTHNLLQNPPSNGDRVRPASPAPSRPDAVPDAPVKLRRRAGESMIEGAAQ